MQTKTSILSVIFFFLGLLVDFNVAAPVHDLNDELQFYKSRYEIAVILFPIFGLITFYFIFATIYIGKKYFLVKKTILKPQQADELVSKEAPPHGNTIKSFSLTTSSIDRHVDKELEEPPKYVV